MSPLPPHPGLPGSKVIPDGWAAAHAPVVDRTLDCAITITPPGGVPAFSTENNQMETPTAAAVYTGPASVEHASQAGADGRHTTVADDDIDERTYLVKIPAGTTAAIEPGHVVLVAASPSTALVGRRLTVTSIARPGREFSRVIFARLYE